MAVSARTTLNAATATRVVPTAVLAASGATVVRNSDAAITIYLGDVNVTSATGLDLPPLTMLTLPFESTGAGALFAIAASGAPVCSVLRV